MSGTDVKTHFGVDIRADATTTKSESDAANIPMGALNLWRKYSESSVDPTNESLNKRNEVNHIDFTSAQTSFSKGNVICIVMKGPTVSSLDTSGSHAETNAARSSTNTGITPRLLVTVSFVYNTTT